MRHLCSICTWCCVLILLGACAPASFGAPQGELSAGAARVDITPPADAALPMSGYAGRKQGFRGIHDHIYVRAIVLSDGTHDAVIISWELIAVPDPGWQAVSQRISRQLGIPVDNIILTAVHDHDAPTVGAFSKPGPAAIAYTKTVEDKTFEAVRDAKANLQPAKVGFATGKCYININRREYSPKEGGLELGYNPDGPSDKTVAVLRFETLSGEPIALLYNYADHGTVMGPNNMQISGDWMGAASRFIEDFYEGKFKQDRSDEGWELQPQEQKMAGEKGIVALFAQGAAGDQNPIVSDSGEDFSMVDGLGRIMGEEVVRIANDMTLKKMTTQASISGSQKVLTCPGQEVAPGPESRKTYTFGDSNPVNIRLSLLRLNDIAITGVSGEVLTPILQRLQNESPIKNMLMVGYANGYSGYIPNDAAYSHVSYEITTSHLKPGCAESGIVNGLVGMMSQH
ncbi:MAG TPA: neutral/alkaline non-lysosomal ceramidase N-terminal domain-containing protein [Terriglobia bacterium]|nr:neutral/alkaline non-lysosomal ceramidase N-terminal domain-containing protein [Terriglobia bacterium]